MHGPETATLEPATGVPANAPHAEPSAGGPSLEIAADLAGVQLSIVNLYLYGRPGAGDRNWVLIDAGLPLSAGTIARAAEARFGRSARPGALVLTHGHFDHVGDLPGLAEDWDVPVYAHPLELPYLTGRSSYPPPDPAVGGGAMAFLSRLYPRGPIDLGSRVRPLPDDGSVPGMPGWRWIHTPGHTAGHVSLFRPADGVLIAGDAFVTTKQESALAVLTRWQHVCRPPAYYTPDWQAARASVARLAGLRPAVAATGHGLPMRGPELREQLDALVRDWDRVAVPAHGRYVHEPAVMDETGVVAVPPPVFDPQLLAVAGVGLAAVVGGMLWRRS
jgi:glyoxylase-like metal-dependent hydrolase (beta-lactamase superfamily II)